jgi:2-isopropylmalate synthase
MGMWSLVSYELASGSGRTPTVRLTLEIDGKAQTEEAQQGDGPIDAAFWAVEKITGIKLSCKEFRVSSASLGRDAIGEVTLEVEHEGQSYRGMGASTDSVEATILAILNSVNRIITEKSLRIANKVSPQDA